MLIDTQNPNLTLSSAAWEEFLFAVLQTNRVLFWTRYSKKALDTCT